MCVTGILRGHPKGFGFVEVMKPKSFPQDVFIPKRFMQNAVDGDTVEVLITGMEGKGPEGSIASIVARGKKHLTGILSKRGIHGDFLAFIPMLGAKKPVVVLPKPGMRLKVGDRVVLDVQEWGDRHEEIQAEVTHVIGHISDPRADIPAAIEEYGLRSEFPLHVLEEIASIPLEIPSEEIKKREDVRKQECFTIDPDTAKDFDDALTISKDEKTGIYSLGVHIADVSYYVKPGTSIDEEAKLRCNSTYFPGKCLPMLPPTLSENLCSLKPKEDRLTASVFMEFAKDGTMTSVRFARTIIRSAHRFTYKEAKEVLDGKKRNKHKKALLLMVELCALLKKKRYERGSIEFSLPEIVVKLDVEGNPIETETIYYDITHQMVEEFMLKANEMVATHLDQKGIGTTYRVHDQPDQDDIDEFVRIAAIFGYKLPAKPTTAELQKLFDVALETQYGHYLAASYIKCMKMAIYSPQNIGHYGLGLTHYCHFTSPIRRYVDLVVHRLLFNEQGEDDDLELIANRCSERERNSAKAESSVTVTKKLRFIEKNKKEDPEHEYEAIVTRLKPFGIYFELVELFLEGFVRLSDMNEDYYEYDEKKDKLRGLRTKVMFTRGQRIRVRLKCVDLITSESSWEILKIEGKK